MGISLQLLLVEDNEDDAYLLVRNLRQSGFDLAWERVQTPVQYQAALSAKSWDVIICDYRLPRFSAPAALEIMQNQGLDLPFIVLSGAITEQTAVEIMRAGAQDVLFKDSIDRLAVVLMREINEARSRAELKRTSAALSENEERYRSLVENSPDAVLVQLDGKFVFLNSAALELFGAESPRDLVGREVLTLFHPQCHALILERMAILRDERVKVPLAEMVILRLDGKEVAVEVAAAPIRFEGLDGSLVFIRDIHLRKAREVEMNRLNRLYVVQSEINRASLHTETTKDFLDEICRLFSSQDGILMAAAVRLVSAIGKHHPVKRPASILVRPSLNVISASGEVAVDLIGLELQADPTWVVRQPRVVMNKNQGTFSANNLILLRPTLGRTWQGWLEGNAWCATAIFPVWVQNYLWGMIAIFASDCDVFSDRDMALLEACVDDVAYGVGRKSG